ncbi:membrane protein DedA, SNARE-associated domain [Paenibacillus sp. UNC496MF]|uniref:VTT domain-containing protein n=1 Tax=Paenibacillus sp. UNC496MF TaxID=1502753 RepID=UPI0008F1A537|nr:VTT domain-containing protein [Paenibacillus sp. UNC496MF]SFI37708.1 membrane protein DedA, SNARE-associated domain [Paenibacillus sp. UNC496MF]
MGALSDFLSRLLETYGYIVLFLSLFFEMLALPLPGELLMTYTGLIVYEGHLHWLFSVLAGGAGASLGMTASYWIGYRLGNPFFEKYGARFHFGPDKFNRLSGWFGRYGNKLLLIAYFIPGVRHLTGYFSGTTRLPFRKYAAFSYAGAFLWVFVFITLGKVLGPKWEQYHHRINVYLVVFGVVSVCAYGAYALIKRNRAKYYALAKSWVERAARRYRSLGTVRLLILAAGAAFLGCFSVMIGLIQDFMAHEFAQFDEVVLYLVGRLFGPEWHAPLTRFAALGAMPALVAAILPTLLWIRFRSRNRLLELAFYLAVAAGGEGLEEGLRQLFHRVGPTGGLLTFPSEQTFMALTVYGFSAYLFVRHRGQPKHRVLAAAAVTGLCFLTGIGMVALRLNYPSDAAAGFAFGGMWLTLNVALMEGFRYTVAGALRPRAKVDA